MDKKLSSIFNDVIGPVMRGPSSSHCAAALRIGRICRDLMDGNIKEVKIQFDPTGSLATTHKTQGSDMGLFGGFLGWDATDKRLPNYNQALIDSGINVGIEITDIGGGHPNTYKMILKNGNEIKTVTAISTGGGMIEIIEIDGASVFMAGDYFETLIYSDEPEGIKDKIETEFECDEILIHHGNKTFVEVKAQQFIPEKLLEDFKSVKRINPVLPIMSRKNMTVPFITCEEMINYNKDKNLELWELALDYESARGGISKEDVFVKMREIVEVMRNGINTGLQGTEYEDRILGVQSVGFKELMEKKKLIESNSLNKIIMYVTSLMEVKSSMGVIVAAPTAGSCGALPGAIFGVADSMNLSEDEITKAMLASAVIGIFISAHSSFAAEVGGCMAECGSGSGMAAAAITWLGGGAFDQSISAASVALQNSFGMVCDPVANRVEAPCLGKNTMAASNALSCANMALANYNHLIPLDEVIQAMNEVAKGIPHELKCTALGGLSQTKTSKNLFEKYNRD